MADSVTLPETVHGCFTEFELFYCQSKKLLMSDPCPSRLITSILFTLVLIPDFREFQPETDLGRVGWLGLGCPSRCGREVTFHYHHVDGLSKAIGVFFLNSALLRTVD